MLSASKLDVLSSAYFSLEVNAELVTSTSAIQLQYTFNSDKDTVMIGPAILLATVSIFGHQTLCTRLSNKNLRIAAEPWPPFLSIYCLKGQEKTFLWDWEADCPIGEGTLQI